MSEQVSECLCVCVCVCVCVCEKERERDLKKEGGERNESVGGCC